MQNKIIKYGAGIQKIVRISSYLELLEAVLKENWKERIRAVIKIGIESVAEAIFAIVFRYMGTVVFGAIGGAVLGPIGFVVGV